MCDGSCHLLSTSNVPATELKMLLVFSFNLHNMPMKYTVNIPIREQLRVVQ